MTRSELLALLAAQNDHLLSDDIETVVDAIFGAITGVLAAGGRVELRDFGVFTAKRRAARVGRNPRTGESVSVESKALPFFKAGKALRQRVNEAKNQPANFLGTAEDCDLCIGKISQSP